MGSANSPGHGSREVEWEGPQGQASKLPAAPTLSSIPERRALADL